MTKNERGNAIATARSMRGARATLLIQSQVRGGPDIVISVNDGGTGIPAEVLEHLFEPFFTTKAERGGSGLGLATVYSIVRKNGGHIEVESKVGSGTRFDVFLPRVPAALPAGRGSRGA